MHTTSQKGGNVFVHKYATYAVFLVMGILRNFTHDSSREYEKCAI